MQARAKALNRQNNEQDKELSEENNSVMTDMVCYLRAAGISEYEQEVVRQDLLQMALEGQARGEGMDTVFGTDRKAFCDEVIGALPKQTLRQRALEATDTVLLSASVLGLIGTVLSRETIQLVRDAVTGKPLDWQIAISIGSALSTILIFPLAWLVVRYICKTALRPAEPRKKQGKVWSFFKLWLLCCGFMAVFVAIAWVGKQPLFHMHFLVACALVTGCFAGHKLLERVL